MTIDARELRMQVRALLANAGFPHPVAEADALLAAVLDRSRGDIELDVVLGRSIGDEDSTRVHAAAARRARREPLQLIVGTAPFSGIDLAVGPGVFIPRPETELLVELAAAALGERATHACRPAGPPRAADLGSGSGAIAVALARAVPDASVWAIEGSPHAWPWLVRNARNLGDGRVHPVFDRIGARAIPARARPLDVLVSNPPYIPRANEPSDPEVRRHDPGMALYGGADGLDIIREIADLGLDALSDGGALLLEHDDHQGADVRAVLQSRGYAGAATHRDLAGRDRITSATRA